MQTEISQALMQLREKKPLILNITNFVTMDFMANALLALGAAPIMSVLDSELEELLAISSAININIGTLDNHFITRAIRVADMAKNLDKPVVLDPVGAGATRIRTETAIKLLPFANIVRGNASEIMALCGAANKTLGVEATHSTMQAQASTMTLAKNYQNTVVVSGPTDFITDGHAQHSVLEGSTLMPLITGMGCTLTAVIAAFAAINRDYLKSSLLATTYFGLCGTKAQHKASSPGSFRTAFIDSLHEGLYP